MPSHLCDDCRKRFAKAPSRNGYRFGHISLAAVRDAAGSGCYLCKVVLASIKIKESERNPNAILEISIFNSGDKSTNEVELLLSFSFIEPTQSHIVNLALKNTSKLQGWPDLPDWDFTIPDTDSTFSENNIRLCSRWLKECETHHDCRSGQFYQRDYQPPLRLIDVESVAPNVRLCHTAELSSKVSYMTLSHCWGDVDFLKLTNHTMASFLDLIPVNLLSKTFRDAVGMTRRLGCKYIWIDALCIIQEDDVDWNKEGVRMAEVYGGSFLNLAAGAARNGNDGLYAQRDPHLVRGFIVKTKLPDSGDKVYTFYCAPPLWLIHRKNYENSVLSQRAWVFQEIHLAPRTLFFGPEQLLWKCCSESEKPLYLYESYPYSMNSDRISSTYGNDGKLLHGSDDESPLSQVGAPSKFEEDESSHASSANERSAVTSSANMIHDKWSDIVTRYSRGKLTHESDKLVALSGVAKSFCRNMGLESSDYLAGLWKPVLLKQLCWYNSDRNGFDLDTQAPSWSWASYMSGTPVNYAATHGADFRISVLDAYATRIGDDFGKSNGGCITLQCETLVEIKPQENSSSVRDLAFKINDKEHNLGYMSRFIRPDKFRGRTYLMQVNVNSDDINKAGFMVIQAQTEPHSPFSESNRGTYRRLGFTSQFEFERDFREAQKNPKACATELNYVKVLGPDENGKDQFVIKLI